MAQSSYDSRRRAAPYSPSVKVRASYKKRPPPLILLSNEYSDTVLWSPGPPNTAQTASSFSSSEASDSSALTPGTPWSSASDKSTRYYALPAFQVSPSVESACIPEPFQDMGKETSHTSRPRSSSSSTNVAAQPWPEERARTTLPLSSSSPELSSTHSSIPFPSDPYAHLSSTPWTLPEYLELLSLVHYVSHHDSTYDICLDGDHHDWSRIANMLNSLRPSTSGSPRSAWDCWHRLTVPWIRAPSTSVSEEERASSSLFSHAPGVQHSYKFVDLAQLIDVYDMLARVLATALDDPIQALPPVSSATVVSPHFTPPSGRHGHPEYPGPGEPPNVPPHTFGDPHDWGLSPWFQMCAVNRTALGRIVDAARTERPDRHALPPDPTIKLPAHLRNAIPPPSPVMVNARHR